MSSSPYDGRAVANYILDLADACDKKLTQMQVLKILYFAHGWFLVRYKEPLVRQNFEAWEYGPVVRVVWEAFRSFGRGPIKGRAEYFDIMTGEVFPVEPDIQTEHAGFIRDVFLAYSQHGGWELSQMTHESGSPWDVLWNSKEPIGRLSLRIDNKSIQEHFERIPDSLTKIH